MLEGRLAEYLQYLNLKIAKDVLWKELPFGGLILVNWISHPGHLTYVVQIEYFPFGIERTSLSIPIRGVVLYTIEIWYARAEQEDIFHKHISRIIRDTAQREADMWKPVQRSATILFYTLKNLYFF
jgi:hypothetical protein